MQLDDEAIDILDRVREAGVPPWSSLSPADGRRIYQQRAQLLGTDPTPVAQVHEVSILGAAGELRLRVYRPTPDEILPILVYLHGGGWTLGDLDSHDEVCRRLARTASCLVVAVDYRLAPEHPYPAALDDSLAAVEWVAQNATELGGDPSRLALGGDSAGGNLTAAVCLKMRDTGTGPRIALQLLIYPAVHARFDTLSYYENAEGKLLTRQDLNWFWRNYLGEAPATDCYACPAEATDLSGLPRALIITAGGDPLRDEGEVYGYRLREAGVHAVTKRYAGMIHGFIGLPADLRAGRDALGVIASELHDAWSVQIPSGRA